MDVAIWHDKMGLSADEIVSQFPTISLADVYAALAHYWDHREEIEREIREERDRFEELRRTEPGPLARRLSES